MMRLLKVQIEDGNYSPAALSDISNLNIHQDIFDVSKELGFGEEEEWMPNTDVPLKEECSAGLPETKPGNCKKSAGCKHARVSSKSIAGEDLEANDAMEMTSSDAQGLFQKQPYLTYSLQKEMNDVTSEAVSVERKSLISTDMKVKHFKSLIAKENVIEGISGNGNVEHLVSKVQNAVKFEMLMDELQLKMKANRDDLEMTLFGNEYTEKSKLQRETVDMYQKKVQVPNHDINVCHIEKKDATWDVFETRSGTVHSELKQLNEQEEPPLQVRNNCETTVENVSEDEAFSPSQNKEYELVGHEILELWKAEMTGHKETFDRLKYVEEFLIQLHREAVKLNKVLRAGSIKNTMSILINFFKRLAQLQLQGSQKISDYHKHARQSFKVEFIDRLRDEMQQLETEKNRLENELNLVITRTREVEERNEALWMEKERHFASEIASAQQKAHCLLEHDEKVEANHIQERHHWKHELEMCRNECKDKQEILYSMLKEREEKLMKESEMWSRLLEAKDGELDSMKIVIKKVVHTLNATKRHLYDLKSLLITHRKDLVKDNKGSYTCSTRSASELQNWNDIPDVEECELEMPLLLEKLATCTEKNIRRLGVEIREEYDRMEKEKSEARLCTMQAKQEKLKNEEHLSERLFLMERFQGDIRSKEAHLDQERKQLQMLLRLKSEEAEKLRGELYSEEQKTQIMAQKFQGEIAMVKRELEKERRERQKDRDLHLSSRQKMVNEILEKEVVWEKQIKGLTQDFFNLKEQNCNKDQEIEMLREEIDELLKHFDAEKGCRGAAVRGSPAWR
ncbi:hypothetical protein SUGI_0435450 [Cryptomeria japonica]|nr:hypothetical protein SUGI_0435450 [Cryptomeria japonica]